MTIREALNAAAQTLEAAGVPDARLDAELLLASVAKCGRMELLLSGAKEWTQEQERRFSSLLLCRAQRQPLQYLLGTEFFYGLPFRVDQRVLIPRPETEELCQWGLSLTPRRVLDLCTGSGAIAVTMKHHCPQAEVFASDVSAEALALARENARLNGAELTFLQGDLWEPLEGQAFDLILSNPPYIPTADCERLQPEVRCEPLLALDGGADGLDFYRRIAADAASHLLPGGSLLLEVGQGEAEAVAELLREHMTDVVIRRDITGIARMVGARRRREANV